MKTWAQSKDFRFYDTNSPDMVIRNLRFKLAWVKLLDGLAGIFTYGAVGFSGEGKVASAILRYHCEKHKDDKERRERELLMRMGKSFEYETPTRIKVVTKPLPPPGQSFAVDMAMGHVQEEQQ